MKKSHGLAAGLAAAAVSLVLVSGAASAAPLSFARVNIDFPFVAAEKPCVAGAYEIEVNPGHVTLRPKDLATAPVRMLVITRLARHDQDRDPEIVFDKVGDKLVLSEVWLENSDGYLVANTPTDHEHRVLGGSKPRQ